VESAKRLDSLDALRGLDMLCIVGLSDLVIHLCVAMGLGWDFWLVQQMRHSSWHGFRFYDMIFPLFLFIAGVSFPYSCASRRSRGETDGRIVVHAVYRGMSLFVLGLLCNGLLSFDFVHLRIWSVLGRIGLSWMLAALLFVAFRLRTRLAVSATILVGYGLLMYFGHAPDFPLEDRFSAKGSIICWIDRALMSHPHIYRQLYDPEGLPGVFTGTVTAMLGMFAGELVRELSCTPQRKALWLSGMGIGLIFCGWCVSALGVCPINKALWSPTFVLVAGGWSCLAFGVFYWIIDVQGWRSWAFLLRIVGLNAITIYLAPRLISFGMARDFLFAGVAKLLPNPWAVVFNDMTFVAMCWLFLYFLYRKNVFLKV